jgi:hypothetical protein
LDEIVPPVADQLMVGFETPGSVAVKANCVPLRSVVVLDDIERLVTVTEALAVTEESAALTAVIV